MEISVKTVSQIIFRDGVPMTSAVEATAGLAGSGFGEARSAGILVSDRSAAVLPTLIKLRPALVTDLKELFKVRVTSLVVVTAWAGFYLGSMRSGISSMHWGLFQALLGIAFVTGGASAMNEVIERKSDAKMIRTAQRPMASGRFSLLQGLSLGMGSLAAGAAILAYFTNPVTVVLTLFTAFTYVAVYTPLKRYTTLATFIGAFPGAMPPLLGWTAARGIIEWPALALFAILFALAIPAFYGHCLALSGRLCSGRHPHVAGGAARWQVDGAGSAVFRHPDDSGKLHSFLFAPHRKDLFHRGDPSRPGLPRLHHSFFAYHQSAHNGGIERICARPFACQCNLLAASAHRDDAGRDRREIKPMADGTVTLISSVTEEP